MGDLATYLVVIVILAVGPLAVGETLLILCHSKLSSIHIGSWESLDL